MACPFLRKHSRMLQASPKPDHGHSRCSGLQCVCTYDYIVYVYNAVVYIYYTCVRAGLVPKTWPRLVINFRLLPSWSPAVPVSPGYRSVWKMATAKMTDVNCASRHCCVKETGNNASSDDPCVSVFCTSRRLKSK
jgi:hypothetical protein